MKHILMIKPCICCVLLLYGEILFSQGITGPTGAEAWMMGGASAAMQNVWAADNNPAAITGIKNSQLGVYSEQRFNQSNNKLANITGVIPTKYLSVGAHVNYYGYSVFNQQKLGLSLGKELSRQFALGVQMSYIATNIQDYGNSGAFVTSLGIHTQLMDKVKIGVILFNLTQAKFAENLEEKIPSYGRIGLVYDISRKVLVQAEADQILNQKLIMRGGLSYKIHEVISLAIGACSNPAYYTFGTAIRIKSLKMDIASSFHEVLGFTPHLGVSLPIKD